MTRGTYTIPWIAMVAWMSAGCYAGLDPAGGSGDTEGGADGAEYGGSGSDGADGGGGPGPGGSGPAGDGGPPPDCQPGALGCECLNGSCAGFSTCYEEICVPAPPTPEVDDPGSAYACAKRGVLRLVRHRAAAFGGRGARLLSVSPGIVDTPMGRREAEQQPLMADLVANSPIGRMLEADEVAAVVEVLVSDVAAAMTGTDVLVDGGAVSQLLG